jgi:hypothetical protein
MNLAFCNQEKQRNEVCLYIFSLYFLLARVLKPVETPVSIIWFVCMHDSNALLRYYILTGGEPTPISAAASSSFPPPRRCRSRPPRHNPRG